MEEMPSISDDDDQDGPRAAPAEVARPSYFSARRIRFVEAMHGRLPIADYLQDVAAGARGPSCQRTETKPPLAPSP